MANISLLKNGKDQVCSSHINHYFPHPLYPELDANIILICKEIIAVGRYAHCLSYSILPLIVFPRL